MSEWVSVKDRLPPLHYPVLAYDGEDIEKAFRTEGCLVEECSWYWTHYDFMDWDGVTHWMELPNKPEEK